MSAARPNFFLFEKLGHTLQEGKKKPPFSWIWRAFLSNKNLKNMSIWHWLMVLLYNYCLNNCYLSRVLDCNADLLFTLSTWYIFLNRNIKLNYDIKCNWKITTIMILTKNLYVYEYWLPAHIIRLLGVHSMTVSRLLKI